MPSTACKPVNASPDPAGGRWEGKESAEGAGEQDRARGKGSGKGNRTGEGERAKGEGKGREGRVGLIAQSQLASRHR